VTAARAAGWLSVPLRWYLGVLFVGASLHKLADPHSFAIDVATYDILPLALINVTAIVLPAVELVAGALLVLGLRVRPAALLVTVMMAVFLAALLVALARGLDMSCGCFASQGAHEDPISGLTVLRDLAWLVMSLWVVAFDRGRVGLDALLAWRRA
jgi:putative oxidoreductase